MKTYLLLFFLSMTLAAMDNSSPYIPLSARESCPESERYKPLQLKEIQGETGRKYFAIEKEHCATVSLLLRRQDRALDQMDTLKEEYEQLHTACRAQEKKIADRTADIENRDKTIRLLKHKIKSLERKLNRTKDELETAVRHRQINLEMLDLVIDHLQERDEELTSSARSTRAPSLTTSPSNIFSTSRSSSSLTSSPLDVFPDPDGTYSLSNQQKS